MQRRPLSSFLEVAGATGISIGAGGLAHNPFLGLVVGSVAALVFGVRMGNT